MPHIAQLTAEIGANIKPLKEALEEIETILLRISNMSIDIHINMVSTPKPEVLKTA